MSSHKTCINQTNKKDICLKYDNIIREDIQVTFLIFFSISYTIFA
jgi:hypothetical protein